MNAFVERLAIAACRTESERVQCSTCHAACKACIAEVRAILAEARDAITDEMLHAGMISISVPDSAVKIAWQAAIDAALKEDQ